MTQLPLRWCVLCVAKSQPPSIQMLWGPLVVSQPRRRHQQPISSPTDALQYISMLGLPLQPRQVRSWQPPAAHSLATCSEPDPWHGAPRRAAHRRRIRLPGGRAQARVAVRRDHIVGAAAHLATPTPHATSWRSLDGLEQTVPEPAASPGLGVTHVLAERVWIRGTRGRSRAPRVLTDGENSSKHECTSRTSLTHRVSMSRRVHITSWLHPSCPTNSPQPAPLPLPVSPSPVDSSTRRRRSPPPWG